MFKRYKLRAVIFTGLLFSAYSQCGFADNPADPNKVLHVAYEAPDDGFDPVKTINYYSGCISEVINESLLGYDYLAMPAKLVPKLTESMPEISDGGKTYLIHLKKGVYFSDDPAFKGKRREMTAADVIYSYKRYLDPVNRSPSASLLEKKIVGMDEVVAQAKATGKFDYDVPVSGLRAIDPYTVRIELKAPDYNFQYALAYSGLAIFAREVIDTYGQQSGMHPVGTGPYMLKDYAPRSKIVLVANPTYRGFTWNFKSSGTAWDDQLVKDMQGKKMPQIGRVEISIIEEEQSRWLAYQGKQLDYDKLPQTAAPTVLNGDKLKPEFTAEGIKLYRVVEPEITYTMFNMKDPLVGGYSLEKNALRRAIGMAYNVKDEIAQMRQGQAVVAEMVMPEGVNGHDNNYRDSLGYDIDLANKLLDRFGYKRGADGFRTLPDGKPLVLKITSEPISTMKIKAEIWKRGLDQIGIHAEYLFSNFADNLKAATECKLMMWGGAWIADYPDGENFLQLLYGPNSGQGNNSCYQSPVFDAMYLKARTLPPGEERNKLYAQMNRQMEADTVWIMSASRIRSWMVRPWVKGFKKHSILHTEWQYLDIDKH
jgi:ABC-type transport system substrate-binding protein